MTFRYSVKIQLMPSFSCLRMLASFQLDLKFCMLFKEPSDFRRKRLLQFFQMFYSALRQKYATTPPNCWSPLEGQENVLI